MTGSNKLSVLAACATLSFGPLAMAADDSVLTNEDVIALTGAGLPAKVIVAKINSSAVDFDTSVEELVALAEAGVDADVLEAMAQGENAGAEDQASSGTIRVGASRAANVRSNFRGTLCEAPGIFLEQDGELVDIDATTAAQTRTGSGVLSNLTYGIVSTKSKAAIRGMQANSRTSQASPAFWFCFEEAEAGLSYQTTGAVNPSEFLLVAFKVNRKRRERTFEIGKFNVWTGGQAGTPPKQLRDVTYEKVKPGVYRVEVMDPLEPGEYGFYYAGQGSLSGFGIVAMAPGATGGGGGGGSKIFAFGVEDA